MTCITLNAKIAEHELYNYAEFVNMDKMTVFPDWIIERWFQGKSRIIGFDVVANGLSRGQDIE